MSRGFRSAFRLSNANRNFMLTQRIIQWLPLVVGWAGGVYGLLRAIALASSRLYERASSRIQPSGQSSPLPPDPSSVGVDPGIAALIVMAGFLVFGTALALLTMRWRIASTLYAFILFAFSLIAILSIGGIFLPATALLLFAAALLWLPPMLATRTRSSYTRHSG